MLSPRLKLLPDIVMLLQAHKITLRFHSLLRLSPEASFCNRAVTSVDVMIAALCIVLPGFMRSYISAHYALCIFFSGYRRHGDLQACIDSHWVQGATQLFCLSIRYCLQNEDGDLTSKANQRWWQDRVLSGAICGVGGGPPCETFSAARLLPDGLPPLRSWERADALHLLHASVGGTHWWLCFY